MSNARITRDQVRAELARVGISLRRTDDPNEWRVNFSERHAHEETAYFTNDLSDALATGLAMARWRAQVSLQAVTEHARRYPEPAGSRYYNEDGEPLAQTRDE